MEVIDIAAGKSEMDVSHEDGECSHRDHEDSEMPHVTENETSQDMNKESQNPDEIDNEDKDTCDQSSVECHWSPPSPDTQRNPEYKKAHDWLELNYVPSGNVLLLCRLVYQHYTHFCSKSLDFAVMDEESFIEFLLKKYPHLQTRRFRMGSNSYYLQGLDIRQESDEYETVVKGRKLDFLQCVHFGNKKKPGSASEGGISSEDKLYAKVQGKLVSKLWINQPREQKELHRKMVNKWFEESYEWAPLMCLLRTSVYEHYLHFCAENNLQHAPQNYFGRLVQKKFPKTKMRRLGCRGESRYYYMGIDIRDSSPFYKQLSQERVVSTMGKPKKNL